MNIKPARNANIELLRIVLMFMIVVHHLLIHATGLKLLDSAQAPVTDHIYIQSFINTFFVIGVNTFVFISGYYGIKFNFNTLLSFVLQAFFYSVVISGIFFYFSPETFSYKNLIKSFLPISSGLWWYITAYVVLYIISPVLNGGIASLNLRRFQFILVALFLFNCVIGFLLNPDGLWVYKGYSVFSFIFIYLLGRYIYMHVKQPFSAARCVTVLLLNSMIIFSIVAVLIRYDHQHLANKLFDYNNPLVLISAISFFFLFRNFNIKSNLINTIAPLTLGVYMIDDHILVRTWLSQLFKELSNPQIHHYISFYSLLFLLGLMIFICCLLIEFIRRFLFLSLLQYLYTRPLIIQINNALNEVRKPASTD